MKIEGNRRIPIVVDVLLLVGLEAFLLIYFDVRYLFYDTIVTGGDTASWYNIAHHLSEVLLPRGRLTGWDMGNFCGYPNFNFYFIPPFLLAVLPAKLFGIPLTITLKWVIMIGIFILPITTYLGLRYMGYRFPSPIMGAAGAVLFVFNEAYTMFGGNTLSTFAGEFCYMFAFALFVLFIGTFYRGIESGRLMILNGLLLGFIGLSHLFVFIPALFIWISGYFRGGRLKYLSGVIAIAFVCMAFWILPLAAYRDPYTTPVYMIWKDFTNLRYSLAGMLIIVLMIGPRFALHVLNLIEDKRIYVYSFYFLILLAASGSFAAAYLMGKYLVLGGDLWLTGLNVSDYSKAPFGTVVSRSLDAWIMPISAVVAALMGGLGFRALFGNRNRMTAFCRIFGGACFSGIMFICVLAFHWVIAKALPDLNLRKTLLNKGFMIGGYGVLVVCIAYYFCFSKRFKTVLSSAVVQAVPQKFYFWAALIFGSIVAYFSAHFLQVPDIRFFPPLAFGLIILFSVDTLEPFLENRRTAVRALMGVTACYIAVIVVIFGAQRASNWYRFNNKGYEMTAGYPEFMQANRYLKTVYDRDGLNPLNAPRVGYEKCDLYGRYGGDRAFESLHYFSGRQTLEGIHYASSMSSRFMAFIQTEFSRDVKTPKPQILSKVNPDALPKHFDLYNLSHLVVATAKVKKALNRSSSFKKEAEFGQLSIYKYNECDNRYVDVPEIRPVLYRGRRWVDDFFAWYKDTDRTDILLVPEQFVSDPDDRKVFAGVTNDISKLEPFRANRLDADRSGFRIETHLDHHRIQFTTNRPGLPHLIKVSYFPNWKVHGANGVYPVSPHLMMVIPRKETVLLYYGRSFWEILGLLITSAGIIYLFWIGFVRLRPIRGFRHKGCEKIIAAWKECWLTLEKIGDAIKSYLFIVIVIASIGLIISGAALRNRPVRIYVAGYRAYKSGVSLQNQKKHDEAGIHYNRAIRTMASLLEDRSRYDHRDVINSLLITGRCLENLKEYEKAENWYRILLSEYPQSRYVGEGYVKIARIYRNRAMQLLRIGLKKLQNKIESEGRDMGITGLELMQTCLTHYDSAIQKDPYSVWATYAQDDIERLETVFNQVKVQWAAVSGDIDIVKKIEQISAKLAKIKKYSV